MHVRCFCRKFPVRDPLWLVPLWKFPTVVLKCKHEAKIEQLTAVNRLFWTPQKQYSPEAHRKVFSIKVNVLLYSDVSINSHMHFDSQIIM